MSQQKYFILNLHYVIDRIEVCNIEYPSCVATANCEVICWDAIFDDNLLVPQTNKFSTWDARCSITFTDVEITHIVVTGHRSFECDLDPGAPYLLLDFDISRFLTLIKRYRPKRRY